LTCSVEFAPAPTLTPRISPLIRYVLHADPEYLQPMQTCGRCGVDNPDEARFCHACAAPLHTDDGARSRKTVTILFNDVVGSTSLGERLDPEVLRRVMTMYFERMRGVLESHGGTVEKYIGDAIVAVFGIPKVHEDDAVRAVRAAGEMREALAEMNGEIEERWGVRIEARTGVHTGEVLADETRPDAPLTADAGNVAARLEQAAGPGEVLLGDPTYQLVRDAVEVKPAGPLTLKGKQDLVEAWRLVSVSAGAPGIVRRLDSPIVGRERELSALRQAFEAAAAERACRLVTVIGEPGLGKSRLAAEFIRWVEDRATVLRGRCLPYGEGITFWPVAEVVREAAGISQSEAPEEAAGKLQALVGQSEEAAAIVGGLSSALGLSEASASAEDSFWAVRRLLEMLAEDRPVVVVFDDIHWGEPTFLDLLEYVAGWSGEASLLLLCMARPEFVDGRATWGTAAPGAVSLRLRPLTEEDSERLIENLLGPAPLDEPTRARIRQAAEGNPLFVEEILRMLVDRGLLHRDDGRWVATGDLSSLDIPPTISALLAARLEQLSVEERSVIQRASVIGKVFWWGAVSELSPQLERPRVGAQLQSLARRQLVRPGRSTFPGVDAFRFGHILIRDAAYQGTTKESRADLHARFAGWLERQAGDRLAEHEEVLGYHLEQAHRYGSELGLGADLDVLATRAARHLASAGQRAFARNDIPATVNLMSRAAGLFNPADPDGVLLLTVLAEALVESGDEARAGDVAEEAVRKAADLGDDRLQAHALLTEGLLRLRTEPDALEQARRDAGQAIEVFERHGDERGLARAWDHLAGIEWGEGKAAQAEEAVERALGHARRAGDHREESEAYYTLSACLVQGPRPTDDGARRAQDIIDLKRDDRSVQAYMAHALAHLRAWQGRFEEARKAARLYREIVHGNGQEIAWADSSEAAADVELTAGNSADAVRILQEGRARFDELGSPPLVIQPFLANALCEAGQLDEAESAANEAIGSGHLLWSSLGKSTLARILARRQDPGAEALARESVAFFEATDFLVFHGRALVDLAEVLINMDRADEPIPVLEQAIALFERKRASVLAEQARATLSRLGYSGAT
jgi:class 3 adenylate cyclase/tetratricopeptide (TPR) repeat protein